MFRRTFGAMVTAAFVLSISAGTVLGGQPGASCGDPGATLNPPGFDSGGFAKAEANYAGSEGTKSLACRLQTPERIHALGGRFPTHRIDED